MSVRIISRGLVVAALIKSTIASAIEATGTYINFRIGTPQLASIGLNLEVADTAHFAWPICK